MVSLFIGFLVEKPSLVKVGNRMASFSFSPCLMGKRVCLLVEGRGSRVTSRGSRVNGRGSRVTSEFD